VGHSAGAEIAELTAGEFHDVDLLVAAGYTHFLSAEFTRAAATVEVPRALQSDYVYWAGTPAGRNRFHHNVDFTEPEVLAKDNQLANLSPSGEILSGGSQQSRVVMGAIRMPLLLVLAERDYIFPVADAAQEMALFASAPDKSLHVVPFAGHSFMLEHNAQETNISIVKWLRQRADVLPSC
jgi:pimeloyl-ACP methyl ester carboxylesterase